MTDLQKRIKAAQQKAASAAQTKSSKDSSHGFLRISIDLVSALAVGILLGYFIDQLLGSKPIGMVIGFFLGSVSGFLSLYRLNQKVKKG
ncbi:MAG: hypothetical protein C0582_05345 [Alphaproteobacteria bacterium]|jgi:ATP synthase protein I|nr:MAG: hypothetical protein C0582_05345 [Alphaproteobacteria bacterium]